MCECPYAVCMCPVAFARRARSGMSTGQILPQGVMAASTMEGHAGFDRDRTGTRYKPGPFLAPWVGNLWRKARAYWTRAQAPWYSASPSWDTPI